MLQQVINLLQGNHLKEAKLLCEQINRDNKKNINVLMLLTEIYQQSGLPLKAENTLRKIIKLKSDYAPAHTNLAMLYHGQGKFSKAEPCYKHSLRYDNNQATVLFNLGSVLQELNKTDEATNAYQQAIKLKPDYAKAYANLGYILRQSGNTKEAIESYKKALQISPDIAEIHYNLGWALLDLGQTEDAEIHQQTALKLQPNSADILSGIAAIYFFKNNIKKAQSYYIQSLKIEPDNIESLCGLSKTLYLEGKHSAAMEHIEKALKINPADTQVNIIKSNIILSLGQLDKALEHCRNILKKTPKNEEAICLAASICEKKGESDLAYNYLKPLLISNNPSVKAILTFSALSKALGLEDEAIEHLEGLLVKSYTIQESLRRKIFFSLGKLHDSKKNYDHAFDYYTTANHLKQSHFNIASMRHNIDSQINVFSSNFKQLIKTSSIKTSRPIFIVGMPRSGTSLLEQILSCHQQVHAGGELPDITQLAQKLPSQYNSEKYYPEILNKVSTNEFDLLAKSYLDHLENIDSEAKYIIDKMPTNFMHLGLIQLLFPNARIIHCMRNPLDTCLSCYFQDFSGNHAWIYDLKNIGKVYLEYRRVMQHWKSVLDIQILEVQYEELVDKQDTMSRQIIDFCNLEWDDECLNFHENKRFAKTASYNQVRQPMYKKSVARWKNYEDKIGDLKKTLKDII